MFSLLLKDLISDFYFYIANPLWFPDYHKSGKTIYWNHRNLLKSPLDLIKSCLIVYIIPQVIIISYILLFVHMIL